MHGYYELKNIKTLIYLIEQDSNLEYKQFSPM